LFDNELQVKISRVNCSATSEHSANVHSVSVYPLCTFMLRLRDG